MRLVNIDSFMLEHLFADLLSTTPSQGFNIIIIIITKSWAAFCVT